MYSVTSAKRKLHKPDRSSGHQNIKTKIKSFFRILYMFSHRIFAHSIRTLYVTRFCTVAFSHFAFYTTPWNDREFGLHYSLLRSFSVLLVNGRCHETPHRCQIQVLGIGKMCLVWCILLISIKKRNKLRISCISDLHFVTLAAYSV